MHFDHGLRGQASIDDAAFVRHVCLLLDVACFMERWQVQPEFAVSEATAREARHGFFRDAMKGQGIRHLLLGHQREDVLESLLMRIARASGLGGLAAPRPIQQHREELLYLRPLLHVSRNRLESCFKDLNIPFRQDASNESADFERNRLRNRVIPAWQSGTQFDLGAAAIRVREHLEEADEAIDTWARDWADISDDLEHLELGWKALPPVAVLKRALYRWLNGLGQVEHTTPAWMAQLLDALACGDDGRWSLGKGFVEKQGSRLSWIKPMREPTKAWEGLLALTPGNTVYSPTGACVGLKQLEANEELLNKVRSGRFSESSMVFLDQQRLEGSTLHIRSWEPGDRYQGLNAPGSRKLQDWFTDRKIPQAQRLLLPVIVTDSGKLVWCPGLPPAHAFRIDVKTKEILQLTYTSHP